MEESNNPTHNVKTPYFYFRQGINLCGPTMLQMVLYRKGAVYDQEELSAYIGTYVSIDHKNSYSQFLRGRALQKVDKVDPRTGEIVKNRKGNPVKVDDARVGFSISRWENKKILEKIKYLGLEVSVHRPSELGLTKLVKDPNEFTEEELKIVSKFIGPENLDKGNDIGMNYRWDNFRGTEDGHYVLISSFNEKDYTITVTDSSPTNPPHWSENLRRFLFGMQPVFREDDNKKRERGFIVFKGPQKLKTYDLSKLLKESPEAPKYIPVAYEMKPRDINPKKFPKPIMPKERVKAS